MRDGHVVLQAAPLAEVLLTELCGRIFHVRIVGVARQDIVVRNQTAVHLRQRVLRELARRILEGDRVATYQIGNAVQKTRRLQQLFRRIGRFDQYVAQAVVAVLRLLHQLDDMEAELRLDDLRQLARLELARSLRKRRLPLRQGTVGQLAPSHRRPRVGRIEARQNRQRRLARDDTLTHLQQALTRSLLGQSCDAG